MHCFLWLVLICSFAIIKLQQVYLFLELCKTFWETVESGGLASESEVTQSCLALCDPMDCSPPGPPSMGFSSQECWSGLPFPSPGDLPDPGIEPGSPALEADTLTSEPPGKPAGQEWSGVDNLELVALFRSEGILVEEYALHL